MQSGTVLGHYRIQEIIGKGGMGEVYRAQDTTLDRDVALKILPGEFASDSERLSRFEREAKMLAALSHPNIASIFGFHTVDDCTFLVMELVEGEDLAAVLKKGPLPVDEAVDIARQIAEGLEDAHEKGIVHRDLKPANVKRSSDGKVKVLDFGLARVYAGQTAVEEDVSSAPTLTAPMTILGTVLGTAAYMSPEQARGKEVDRRADIWSFGVILFEMLTGKQLFAGETASDTLAGILKSEPDWEQLPAGLPPQVESVLRRCLAKEPRQRLRDIGEARVRLEDPAAESGIYTGPIHTLSDEAGGGRFGRWLPWGLLAASLLAVFWLVWVARPGPGPGVLHVAVPAPDEVDFHIGGSFPGLPEVSPDGRRIIFSGMAREGSAVGLYVRALDQVKPVALGGTNEAQYPFWSADGKWVAYYARNDGLMKIMVDGGPPQFVTAATNGKGGSWNQTDDLLFTKDYNTSIFTVSASGGESRQVTDLANDQGYNSHRHPQFMPDGRSFIYFARGAGKVESEIRFMSLDGGPAKPVIRTDYMGYYASGHLLFVSHGSLMAQPFDPATGEVSGTPVLVLDDVLTLPGASKGAFSISNQGTLAYLQGEAAEEASISWRDRRGTEAEKVGDLASYDMVSLSPDNSIAVVGIIGDQSGTWDLWIVDLERNFRTRFTFDPADDADMVWSRDSRRLYFTSDRSGVSAIYVKEVGSPELPREIYNNGETLRLWDVSGDGQTIFLSQAGEGSGWDLWSVDLSGDTEPRTLYRSGEHDVSCRLSPDEKWLTFSGWESGPPQIYLAPWPAMAPVTQVSTTSGTWSQWTRDGAELIFQQAEGQLVAVSMTVEDGRMRIGEQEPLFDFPSPVLESVSWSVAADGERFLTVDADNAVAPPCCNIVLGWTQLVEER